MGFKVLGICGAGGLGREVLELAKIINNSKKQWDEIVFIVDVITATEVNGIEVIEYEDAKNRYDDSLEIVIGVGEPAVREKISEQLNADGLQRSTLIHPDIHIPDTTMVGRGVVIQYGCFISCNVKIGDNVVVQSQCNICHDAILLEGCMISCFGNIAGNVKIGDYTYIGMSAAIREGVSIGKNSIIGMGSVVCKDVPDEIIALGIPARSIARNNDRKVFRH